MDVYYQSDKGTAGSLDDTEKQVVFVKEELSMIFCIFFTQRNSLRRRNSILNLISLWSLGVCHSDVSPVPQLAVNASKYSTTPSMSWPHPIFSVCHPFISEQLHPNFTSSPFLPTTWMNQGGKKTRLNTKQHSLALKQRTHLPQCCIKSCI